MNLPDEIQSRIALALARFEPWLETYRGAGGYRGPVVGMRGQCLSWCGPGHDWRWEGLLDGWCERLSQTRDLSYAQRIDQALADLANAQLADGSLRNSAFDQNPLEGGMPYEPMAMAAAMRAVMALRQQGREPSADTRRLFEWYAERRLIQTLWNKNLQTFNNWLQSDFESYSPAAVAAIVMFLADYADLTGQSARISHYLHGAGASLLAVQVKAGALCGAVPLSNRSTSSFSPFLAAWCLPAWRRLATITGDDRYSCACEDLRAYLRHALLPEGGVACMDFQKRTARLRPVFVGATAHIIRMLLQDPGIEEPDPVLIAQQTAWLLDRQMATGAFDTAVGFGALGRRLPCPPDWRDVLPVVGWNTFAYALLARFAGSQPIPLADGIGLFERPVTIKGAAGILREDAVSLSLVVRRGRIVYDWKKSALAPTICEL